jgi:hypothetical protein
MQSSIFRRIDSSWIAHVVLTLCQINQQEHEADPRFNSFDASLFGESDY